MTVTQHSMDGRLQVVPSNGIINSLSEQAANAETASEQAQATSAKPICVLTQ